MLANHIRIALRNLLRDHLYSIINIGGLAVGIAASVLLMLWVQDELSFDRFHQKADRIYRVNANFDNSGNKTTWSGTPGPVAPFGKQQIPAIQEAGRISENTGMMLFTYEGKQFAENYHTAHVDPNFFTVFDFPLIKGNSSNPFPDNKSILLSERIAKKYFGDSEAMGKVVRLDNKEYYTVTGVLKNMPENSSLRYDILFPFDILIKNYQGNDFWKSLESDWGNYFYFTYLLIDPSASPTAVAKQLSDIHHAHQKESGVNYSLQPLTALHLYSADMSEEGIQTVRIFLIVSIAILLIACINYINLATARATKRAKEVGVRKTVGASRSRLVAQFLTESVVISVLALVLSLILIQLAIPFYNDLPGKNISFDLLSTSNLVLLAGALFVTTLTAGVYPAMVLSSFQPLQVIRGKLTISGGNSLFRKILVITQFALSIVIIVGTIVVDKQLTFIRNKKLGFNKENIFTFGMRGEMFKNRETIRTELSKQPGIEGIALSNQSILSLEGTTGDTDWEGKGLQQGMMVHPVNIDEHFIDVTHLELAEGRGFTGSKSDTAHFILNETAVEKAGLVDPIGKSFTLWQTKGTIIGVVKDFHHSSIKTKIEPTVFFHNPSWYWLVYVKTNGKDNAGAIASTEKVWKQYNAEYPFEYQFLDSSFDAMYKTEQRTGRLFTAFSVVAIFISCLGLFGLATFTAAQRIKEIGIRKVMGASVNEIVVLLSKDFLKLIVMALVIAVPASYFGMQNWLQDFAYRIPIDWTVFVVAGGISLLIAFLTISFQTIKAAMGNPVESLRTE